MVLKLEDLPAIWTSGAAFARKVDLAERPEVIRALDAEVDRIRAAGHGNGHAVDREGGEETELRSVGRSHRHPPAGMAVVGMHRSGTSATAGLLVGLGLVGPKTEDLVPATESNERGHWESESVHLINVKALGLLGADTYAPPPPPEPGWEQKPEFDHLRDQAAEWVVSASDGRPIVLKDPRLCITLPLWKSALPAPLPTLFVLRDPLEVAHSLQERDKLPIVLGLALWDRYVRAAALSLKGSPTLVLDYPEMLGDPVKWVDVVCGYLEECGVQLDPNARTAGLKYLDTGLRHQKSDGSDYEPLIGAHREVHDILVERVGTHSAWKPPELPPAPPWADYVLELRREVVLHRHDLYWIEHSRVFQSANAVWRLTGSGPRRSVALYGTDSVEQFETDFEGTEPNP